MPEHPVPPLRSVPPLTPHALVPHAPIPGLPSAAPLLPTGSEPPRAEVWESGGRSVRPRLTLVPSAGPSRTHVEARIPARAAEPRPDRAATALLRLDRVVTAAEIDLLRCRRVHPAAR